MRRPGMEFQNLKWENLRRSWNWSSKHEKMFRIIYQRSSFKCWFRAILVDQQHLFYSYFVTHSNKASSRREKQIRFSWEFHCRDATAVGTIWTRFSTEKLDSVIIIQQQFSIRFLLECQTHLPNSMMICLLSEPLSCVSCESQHPHTGNLWWEFPFRKIHQQNQRQSNFWRLKSPW